LDWAAGEIVCDPPEKVEGATPQTDPVARRLAAEWARATTEILVEQSYFVPGPPGAPGFRELQAGTATVRILTSGADTTDVPIVYGAYRRSRRDLLAAGIELHEYRRQPARRKPGEQWDQVQPPFAALHSKVLVFDRRTAWIGSYNLDPRSARLNTEIALVVRSERLAGELAAAILDDLSPERSWRVRLTTNSDRARGARGPIVWVGDVNGRPVTLRHDPATTWRRIEVFFQSLIPGLGYQL
jgi:putative cardiolipin synthase